FQLLRQMRPAVLLFILAIAPYLLLGLIEGRLNILLLGDFARYGMSAGFFLFALWAVKNVPARTMVRALATVLLFYIVIRIGLHLWLSGSRTIRYGREWEVILVTILIASSFLFSGLRYVLLLVGITAIIALEAFGITRSLVFGFAVGAAAMIVLVKLAPTAGRDRILGASVATMVVVGLLTTLPITP